MKLYIVKGIEIDRKRSNSTTKRVDSFIGFYSNLKEVYSQFERKSIKSYSSIASKISDSHFYITNDSKFLVDGKMMKFQQIRIERVQVNKVYNQMKYVNISPLIAQQFSDFNF
tara:strand:- start:381 stop:719 length:339 start_codon:yes stop_codon:yes gene_type:complete